MISIDNLLSKILNPFPYVACTLVFAACLTQTANAQNQKVILVVGAPGEEQFGKQFQSWADAWQSAIEAGDADLNESADVGGENKDATESEQQSAIEFVRIGSDAVDESKSDLEQLKTAIESTTESTSELWLVFIGHGTDDRKLSKFNLRGKDVSANELNGWLKDFKNRVVVINCASSSAGFIAKLKSGNRIVITSTKSPAQHNFSRFGKYLAEAVADPTLDLDKDQQTSLLEAFIAASVQTQEFYIQETRLATELAMIDDNGDGKGTPADWFQGTRVVKQAKRGTPDGLAANQVFLIRRGAEARLSEKDRERRDELESKLEKLRGRKKGMSDDAYYDAMEPILLELAKTYFEPKTQQSEQPAAKDESVQETKQENRENDKS